MNEKQTNRRRDKRAVKTKSIKPGERLKVERGIFARRDSEGNLQYGISYRDKARKQVRKMVGPTLELARKALAEGRLGVKESETVRSVDVPTFEQYAYKYLETVRDDEMASAPRVESTIRFACKYLGDIPLDKITTLDVRAYKTERRKHNVRKSADKAAKSTVNRDLIVVKKILNEAVREDYIAKSPAAGKDVPLYETPKGRKRVLTEKEEMLVYAAAEPWLKPLITFAIHTVMRRGEMLGMKWNQVVWNAPDGPEIRLDKTKNGEPRDVPINDAVAEILRRQESKDSGYVLTRDGKPITGDQVHQSWKRAVKRAGIPHCRWHDLRHTGCTRLIEAGVSVRVVADIAGHKNLQTTMGYTHPTRESKRAALNSLRLYCTSTAHG